MIVIGLVGEKGGGKGTFVEILNGLQEPKKSIVHLRSSDLLLEITNLIAVKRETVSRKQLIQLAIDLENNFGKGCISRGMKERIMRHEGIIIFDGVRLPTDVEIIRSFTSNILIYITARPNIRYDRIKKRKEKAREETLSYDQFLSEENLETEWHIPEIGKTADIRISNDGSYAEFRSYVVRIFQESLKNAS